MVLSGGMMGTYQGVENTLSREHERITKDIAKYMNYSIFYIYYLINYIEI